jgi:hypothetical protein
MNEDFYKEQRTRLANEFWFLKSKRLYLAAKARVRKIAELDFEFKGIPKEETLKKFKYDSIKSKGE